MAEKVFLNDELVEIDKACIPVRDSGFLYGAGLFETMRSCNRVVFALNDHLDRLFFSADSLSINRDSYDKKYIIDAIYQTLAANKLTDARLRLTLTSGPMAQDDNHKPTLLITATEYHPYPDQYYKTGALVVLCPFKQNPSEPIYGHKTINYYSRILALDIARKKHAVEALWFTIDNRLAEGCVSNVFLVKDSKIFTPPVATPVLAGIARKTICEIAMENSIELAEKDLFISDLLDADEVFLTNVIMEVLPVTKIEAHTVGNGKIGSVSKKLKKLFSETVRQKCRKK